MKKLIGIVALAAAGAALWAGWPAERKVATPAAAVAWPEGQKVRYDLEWTAATTGLVAGSEGGQTVNAATTVTGEVALESLGRRGEDVELALSYGALHRFEMRMHGQPIADDGRVRAALVGHRAFLTVSPRGEIRSLRYDEAAPPAAREALRSLATQLHLVVERGEDSWEAVEPVALGRLKQQYRREGEAIERHPLAFESIDAARGKIDGTQKLDGGARIVVRGGGLESITDEEDWSYTPVGASDPLVTTHFSFKLARRRSEPFDPVAVRRPTGAEEVLAARADDPGFYVRRDGRLAEGVTLDTVFDLADGMARGARPKGPALIKAGAYLRLHPEDVKALVRRFADDALGQKGRGMLLDILVQAGDAAAQAAMREALSLPGLVITPGERGILVQRFTLLEAPRPESVAFLEAEYARARQAGERGTAQGAAAALGAVADHLAQRGDDDRAATANALLRRELESGSDPELRSAVVTGLGNAKRAENVELIASLRGDGDPRLRSAVASALRTVDVQPARAALLELAADPSAAVSVVAFGSLRKQTVGAVEWQHLRRLVEEGATNPATDASLVALIKEQRERAGTEGDTILRLLLARSGSPDDDLGNEIRSLLGG